MEGTLKADKHFVTFAFDPQIQKTVDYGNYLWIRNAPELGYVWIMCFIDAESYLIDIMPMDEARHMYE